MLFDDLTSALGYSDAPLYRENDASDLVAPEDIHLIRSAREAGTKGTFFFRTSPEKGYRPAVHIAEAHTGDEARAIHRRLWNQGINPFLIVLLPGEVRVYAGFEDPATGRKGLLKTLPFDEGRIADIAPLLAAYNADAINRGGIWEQQRKHLKPDARVDATLLSGLKTLSEVLQHRHRVSKMSSHALIGRFVYLHYLRARGILTDEWMEREAAMRADEMFSVDATMAAFRRLSKAVEATFNGRIFPIPWGAKNPPRAEAVREVARVFAGEDPSSGQLALPFTAFDFSWIPIELLSSIYEQFLHAEGPEASQNDGAHYTPEPLAEYLVSEVQSVRPLKAGMRILDPCCGSGVFLVIAFRRLVEQKCAKRQCPALPPEELKRLLTHSIYAVERNRTACEIAAFSLILAMLTYVEPRELHRLKRSFKFPSLIGKNLFAEDFFDPRGRFWSETDPDSKEPLCFHWILGNPPWLELEARDSKAAPMRKWIAEHRKEYGLARERTGEAFAWKVGVKLAKDGVAGLVLAAKTLTNDQLKPWRAKFFASHRIHRVTNFANLAYVIFPKVKEPAMTLTFSQHKNGRPSEPILHVGPFVANQIATSRSRKAWVIGATESEMKSVASEAAASGDASIWKIALWGTHRDVRELERLKAAFPTTLGTLARERGWYLALGLQLRENAGKKWRDERGVLRHENESVDKLKNLRLLDHKALVRAGPCLEVADRWLLPNSRGTYVRWGRKKGLGLIQAPHLFLWNDFAAFSEEDFIFEHSKVALAAKRSDADWLRAISLIWTCSVTQFSLVLELSSDWGFGRSLIDLGDAENARMPALDATLALKLGAIHRQLSAELSDGRAFDAEFRRKIDEAVAAELNLPRSLMEVAMDFTTERLTFNQGVVPESAKIAPRDDDLRRYAARLTAELDAFISAKARHRITILHGSAGICATIEITREKEPIAPMIRSATGDDARTLASILRAAEHQFSQWVYVKRSVRMMDGDVLRLIKPARRVEWTEGRALLDAGDVIAEIASRQK